MDRKSGASKIGDRTKGKEPFEPVGKQPAPAVAVEECKPNRPKCGIIMPISSMPDCPKEHWAEVRSLLTEAAEEAGFDAALVSQADEAAIIQKTIVQNVYKCEMIVCDVSCKNPNVMFELGLRVAFGKPVVIVKDDITSYTFDVNPLEHVQYPRSLHHYKTLDFKSTLAQKIVSTHTASTEEGYVPFIKTFGAINSIKLEGSAISADQAILGYLTELSGEVRHLKNLMVKSNVMLPGTVTPWSVSSYPVSKFRTQMHHYPSSLADAIDTGRILEDDEDITALIDHIKRFVHVNSVAEVDDRVIARAIDELPSHIRMRYELNSLHDVVATLIANNL